MKRIALVLACCVALPSSLFAESVTEKTGINSTLGISPSTADFVNEAAISDMFEIQSSQLAVDRSDAATKTFAQQMITDHQKTSTELKGLVQSGAVKVSLPTDLDSSHKSMLDKLRAKSGSDFTKLYHDDQVSAHKAAVSLFQRYAKGGENPQLKEWASRTEPTLEHHLQMAQGLDE